ncbi:MAG: 2,3-bisphosphoglycerate-independent phosphoglycerate mutase [Candidatus Pacebacteria bacterium]|nr:2,3-bisphosphoglycerate-independent phosphoglycerate mutase [Candidatus Paceibacterota bacterium]
MKKILFTILDGLGDREIASLNGMTPLESAKTPNFDYMVTNGVLGLVEPFKFLNEKHPTSEGTHIGLFGYKDYFLGRGPYEAAGINMPLYKGDVALRVNFATIENGIILDRRAGRIKETEPLIKALLQIEIKGVKFDLKRSNGHRAVLVLRGENLSPEVTSNDSGKEGEAPLKIVAMSEKANFTANILNEYVEKAHQILNNINGNKANYLLLRGAGQFEPIYSFKEKYGRDAACIAGGGLYKGIAKMIGMDVIDVKSATADIDTDLWDKFEAVSKALEKYDFVFLHIKGTDVCSHDGRYEDKKKFIEEIDTYFKKLIKREDLLIVVTGDHSTPCELKEHSLDLVPVLIYGNGKDGTTSFSEKEAKKGSLGIIKGEKLLDKILNI